MNGNKQFINYFVYTRFEFSDTLNLDEFIVNDKSSTGSPSTTATTSLLAQVNIEEFDTTLRGCIIEI